MEPPYSVLADALFKYQSSLDWIQALWLVTVGGSMACLTRDTTAIALALLESRKPPRGGAGLVPALDDGGRD